MFSIGKDIGEVIITCVFGGNMTMLSGGCSLNFLVAIIFNSNMVSGGVCLVNFDSHLLHGFFERYAHPIF